MERELLIHLSWTIYISSEESVMLPSPDIAPPCALIISSLSPSGFAAYLPGCSSARKSFGSGTS